MNTKSNVLMASLTMLGLAGCLGDAPTAESESELTTPQGDITQQILARAAASSYHLVRNLAYSQCMGAPTGALNEILRISTCGFDQKQRWAFVATSAPDTYYLVNQFNGLCVEVNNGTANPGEFVDEWHCNGSTAEQWVQSIRIIDGIAYQQFRHASTSLCLDTVGAAGSQLMQWTCGATNDAQTWLVQ